MIKTHYCIQCIDRRTGKTGDFVVEPDSPSGAYRAMSPVFQSLNLLFDWMAANCWELETSRDQPFGCVNATAVPKQ